MCGGSWSSRSECTIAEFPLAVGVVGTLLAAPLAALAALAALLNDCTIEVERVEPVSAAESPAAEQAVRAARRDLAQPRDNR